MTKSVNILYQIFGSTKCLFKIVYLSLIFKRYPAIKNWAKVWNLIFSSFCVPVALKMHRRTKVFIDVRLKLLLLTVNGIALYIGIATTIQPSWHRVTG